MDAATVNSLSDLQYIHHFRLDDVMQHLTYALLQHRPVNHQLFTTRWLQHLKVKMEENGTPNSAVGINLLDLDGTKAPIVRPELIGKLGAGSSVITDSSTHSSKQLRSLHRNGGGGRTAGDNSAIVGSINKMENEESAAYAAATAGGRHRGKSKHRVTHLATEKAPRSQASKALVDLVDKLDTEDIPAAYKQLEAILKNRETVVKKKNNESLSSAGMLSVTAAPPLNAAPGGPRLPTGGAGDASDSGPAQGQETTKRRIGISATPIAKMEIDKDYKPPVFEKPKEELQTLMDSLQSSTLFSNMLDEQRLDIALAMKSVTIGAGEPILRQGHPSTDLLYFTMSGKVDIIKDGKVVASVGSGHYFGELELMTNVQSCAATVQTATEVEAYVLEKETYQNLVLNFTLANRKKFQAIIEKVDFFQALPDYEKMILAEALNTARYEDGDHIIRCGEASPWMYIVMSGKVTVVGRKEGAKVKIIDLGEGDVVGELEFLFHHDAVADVVAAGSCTVAKMSRQHFEMCCGSVDDNLKQFVAKGKYEHYMKNAADNVHSEIKAAERRQAKKVDVGDGAGGFGSGFPEFLPEGEIIFGSRDQSQVFRFPLLPTQHDKLCLVGVQEDGTILFWNSVMMQLTRFPESEAVGSSIFSFAASPLDQKLLHELVSTARKWTGNCEGFFAAGDYSRKNIAFANANGISKTFLNLSVIPPTVAQPKSKAEILLLVAHEGKRKAPPPAFDVGDWLMNGLKPKIEGLTRDVTAAFTDLEAGLSTSIMMANSQQSTPGGGLGDSSATASSLGRSLQGKTSGASSGLGPLGQSDIKQIGYRLQKQMRGLERHIQKFETVVSVDLNALSQDWQAISVRLLVGRVQTELAAEARTQGNKFSLIVNDNVPTQNVYMDVTSLSESLLYILRKTNAAMKDREIKLVVETEVVEETKVPAKSVTTRPGRTKKVNITTGADETVGSGVGGGGGSRDTTGTKESFAAQFSQSYMKVPSPTKDDAMANNSSMGARTASSGFESSGRKESTPDQKGTPDTMGDTMVQGATPNNVATTSNRRLIKYIISDDGPGLAKETVMAILDRDGGGKADLLKGGTAAGLDDINGAESFNRRKPQGVGLRRCRGIINRNGGTFEVHSVDRIAAILAADGNIDSEGKPPLETGTTFVLGFPLLVDQSEEGGESGELGSPLGGKLNTGKPMTTVLVESNQIHRSAFCSFLWGRRHAVLPADNWTQVLQLIKDGTCDILILDPEALLEEFVDDDGIPIDPMAVLRQHTKKMAVIVTSESFDPELCTATSTGVLALPKPCPVATLHVVIQQAESNVNTIRDEAERVGLLRDTFNKIKRSDVQVGKMLGKGSFGGVYEALDVLTGGKMAMKQLKVTDGNRAAMEELANEIETMTTLQHENIVHYFYCTFERTGKDGQAIKSEGETGGGTASSSDADGSSANNIKKDAIDEAEANIKGEEKMNVFMELADGGTVADRIKKYPDGMPLEELVPLLRGTLDGLAFVHGVNMVHCDMKPANVFLDRSGKPKIGDFGTAKVLKPDEKIYIMKGTPLYMSPECMNADEEEGIGFDLPADIWSLGCIVLEMATGFPPFSKMPSAGGPMGIFSYVGNLKDYPDLSPLFKKDPAIFEFVKACLDPDPAGRATAKQLQNFNLITDGGTVGESGPAVGAQKMLARARILHVLNKYVAFQEPDSDDFDTDDEREHSGGKMAVSKAIKDADADDFFADSDDDDEEEEEVPQEKRKIVVPKRRDEDDFFADTDDEDEEAESESGEDDSSAREKSDSSANNASSMRLRRTNSRRQKEEEDDYRPVLFGGGGTRRGWAAGGVAAMSVDLGGDSGDGE